MSETESPENTDNSVVTDLYDFLLPVVREEVANTGKYTTSKRKD